MMKLFRALLAVRWLWKDFGEEERRESSKAAYREARRREMRRNAIWAFEREQVKHAGERFAVAVMDQTVVADIIHETQKGQAA